MKLAPPRMFNERSLVVLTIVIGVMNAYKRMAIGNRNAQQAPGRFEYGRE